MAQVPHICGLSTVSIFGQVGKNSENGKTVMLTNDCGLNNNQLKSELMYELHIIFKTKDLPWFSLPLL